MDRDPLTPEYLEDCRRRAKRFQGQWTGTSGALAADVMRLLWEVERLKVERHVARSDRFAYMSRAAGCRARFSSFPRGAPRLLGLCGRLV
jgi:hypothetical protein